MADEAPASPKGARKFASGQKPGAGSGGEGLSGDDALLYVMRKRWARSMSAEGENRKRWDTDTNFLVADDQGQWDGAVKGARVLEGRPVLQFNLLPKFFFQIANEIRQNSPGFSAKPEQGEATPEAATILEGMLRHINNRSMGDEARHTACDQAIAGGFGYYGITTQYCFEDLGKLELPEPDTGDGGEGGGEDAEDGEAPPAIALTPEQERDLFQQEIRIRHIPNALSCHDDPEAKLPDHSDRRFFFIEDLISKEDFAERYPEAALTQYQADAKGDDFAGWWTADDIRVVEYWWVEETWRTVKGRTGPKGQERTRRIAKRQVKWAICTAKEKLEGGDWAGLYIPFIKVVGWKMNLKGKTHLEGLTHQAIDPQVGYNYMRTAQVERVGLQALSPWLLAEGQEKGHENQWQQANSVTLPYLLYKPTASGDQPAPPPQRQMPPPPPGDVIAAAEASKADVYDGMRMSPPAVGQMSNTPTLGQEKLRMLESDQGNYHFIQSLKTAIGFEGRIIKDLIPKVYDTEQKVRILGEDGSARMVTLNPQVLPGAKRQAVTVSQESDGARGIRKEEAFDLGVGSYDVVVQMGPAFSTQQDAAKADMMELIKAGGPTAMMLLAPFWARMSNLKERETIAEMLEALYPPQAQAVLAKAREGGADKMQVAQLRAALGQAVQTLQAMQGVIQQLSQKVQDKDADRALKAMETAVKEETKRLGGVYQLTGQAIHAEAKLLDTGLKSGHFGPAIGATAAVRDTKDAGLSRAEQMHDETQQQVTQSAQPAQPAQGGGSGGSGGPGGPGGAGGPAGGPSGVA